ncbi:MAG: hypothetical protein IPH59_11760 [bacterium]|nr:hypothetical protein [bacterium]
MITNSTIQPIVPGRDERPRLTRAFPGRPCGECHARDAWGKVTCGLATVTSATLLPATGVVGIASSRIEDTALSTKLSSAGVPGTLDSPAAVV